MYRDAETRYQRYLDSGEPRCDDAAEDLARLRISGRGLKLSSRAEAGALRQLSEKAEIWLNSGARTAPPPG